MNVKAHPYRAWGKVAVIAGCLLMLLAIYTASPSGRGNGHRSQSQTVVLKMTADDLQRAYDANPSGTENRFTDCILDLKGKIASVDSNHVSLLPDVYCRFGFDLDSAGQLAELSEGQIVTIRGRFLIQRGMFVPRDGFLSMRECSVVTASPPSTPIPTPDMHRRVWKRPTTGERK